MNKYSSHRKVHKNKQGDQIYLIQKEGKPDTYIDMVDLERELARAEARVIEIKEDIAEVRKLPKK